MDVQSMFMEYCIVSPLGLVIKFSSMKACLVKFSSMKAVMVNKDIAETREQDLSEKAKASAGSGSGLSLSTTRGIDTVNGSPTKIMFVDGNPWVHDTVECCVGKEALNRVRIDDFQTAEEIKIAGELTSALWQGLCCSTHGLGNMNFLQRIQLLSSMHVETRVDGAGDKRKVVAHTGKLGEQLYLGHYGLETEFSAARRMVSLCKKELEEAFLISSGVPKKRKKYSAVGLEALDRVSFDSFQTPEEIQVAGEVRSALWQGLYCSSGLGRFDLLQRIQLLSRMQLESRGDAWAGDQKKVVLSTGQPGEQLHLGHYATDAEITVARRVVSRCKRELQKAFLKSGGVPETKQVPDSVSTEQV